MEDSMMVSAHGVGPRASFVGHVPVLGRAGSHRRWRLGAIVSVLALSALLGLAGQASATGTALAKKKPPVITGTPEDGQVLTATDGSWKGTPPTSFAFQWVVCLKGTCTPIAGANESSYRVYTAQIGHKIRVIVTASNSEGSARSQSKATKKVTPGPPANTEPPTVSGTPIPLQTLSASTGTWAGTPTITYSYQWRSCNVFDECAEIPGATGSSYTVEPSDVADSLEVVVTATNAVGTSSVTSAATSLVGALSPSDTSLPSITGSLIDGQLLSAVTGSWSGTTPLTYSYQWQLCNTAGEACEDISEALESTLKLGAEDVGSTLRVLVTATNSAGSTSATSSATSLVGALLPSDISLPSISGALTEGGLLSAVTGSWSGTAPISYGYQWQLCNTAGEACKDISEALETTLKLGAGDIGSTLRVVVTATNAAGSTSASSSATGLVKALLPSNTGPPTISGLLQVGKLLTAAEGKWAGTAPITYTYQWQTCKALLGEGCANVAEATKDVLTLSLEDVGLRLRVIVTATNAAGSTAADSEETGLLEDIL